MRRIGWMVVVLSALNGCDSDAGRHGTPYLGSGGSTGGSSGGADDSTPQGGSDASASGASGDTAQDPSATATATATATVTGQTSASTGGMDGTSTGASGESGSEGEGGESSETGAQIEPQPCSILAFDAPIGPPWQTLEGEVSTVVAEGQLHFEIPPAVGFGIVQYDGPVQFDEAFLRARISGFDASEGGTLVGINLDTGASTESVSLQIQGGVLEAIHGVPESPLDVVQAPLEGYPVDLQLRAEMDSLVFEVSYDGVTWQAIRTLPRPAFLDAAHVNLVSGNWMAVQGAHTASVDELEACAL